jgi:hypothetical protein
MIYEECMDLVEAFQASVELVDEMETARSDLKVKTEHIRDYLGEFIGSLLEESPIGDRHKRQSDE